MDYNKLVKRERKKDSNNNDQREDDSWKWLCLSDKEGVRLYGECLREEMRDMEYKELEKKCERIQNARRADWLRDREYRKMMGEKFYECKDNEENEPQ